MRWQYLIILALLGYLSTGIAQIRPEERALVRRFGLVVARPGPGLWIGFPYGIDEVDRIPVRTVRQLDAGYNPNIGDDVPATPQGQFLTGDENLVNVKLVLDYAIDDREGALEDFWAQRDQVDAILIRETEALAAEWIGGRTVDEVLLTGRAALSSSILQRLSQRVTEHRLGVVLQRISVDYLAAPTEVRDAFEAVNQAQTAIRTRENQAQQEAAQRIRDARSLSFRLEQQAAAYREEQTSLARAEAGAFSERLQQYQRLRADNPNILNALWWEVMGKTLMELRGRGRIEVLDHFIGKDGLDITQFLPPRQTPGP